ncbi:T9SS C-terminal target domain-containing protein [Chryseobacterium bernardetii]|uniref:T9SS C-terminal target domain-containing protein n=1 Tax=Chryseobacterium bernardetii TaxID=1241978 RepID=A0A3G6TE42_9FLAO|nr:T9SS type A sorting domain-containing protein [Chryseobacterium bernardetii]AZB26237.1 T9SS C-terminal target domain-containing protein [Chryseobacterium bernardetii]
MKKTLITLTVILGQLSSSQCFKEFSPSKTGRYTAGIKTDGTLWTWGEAGYGALGNNLQASSPTQITSYTWKNFSLGRHHTLAVKSDGTLWAWGLNNYKQLGNGTNVNQSVPAQIGTDSDWGSVMTGEYSSFAIKINGELWAWGNNASYGLGLGHKNEVSVPTRVGTDTDWKKLSSGGSHTIALKNNGSIWGWGLNASGQVGAGNTFVKTPIQIGTDTNWKDISVGYKSSFGIKNNNTIWAWGDNYGGQLGNGGLGALSYTPIQVGSDNNWKIIKAGGYQVVALKYDNTLWGWGSNGLSELGGYHGTLNYKTPIRIGLDSDWKNIYPGYAATYAEKNDNTMWVTGDQCCGEFGSNFSSGKHYPLAIISGYCAESVLATSDLPKKNDIMAFYPNPVKNMLNISLDSKIEGVEVYEMSGKKIKDYTNVNNFQLKVSFSELLPAIYIVKIKTKNEVKTVKIVKE